MATYITRRIHPEYNSEFPLWLFGDTTEDVAAMANWMHLPERRYDDQQLFGAYKISFAEARHAKDLGATYKNHYEVQRMMEHKAVQKAEESMHKLANILENYRDQFAKDDAELQSIIDKIKSENMKNPPENLE